MKKTKSLTYLDLLDSEIGLLGNDLYIIKKLHIILEIIYTIIFLLLYIDININKLIIK